MLNFAFLGCGHIAKSLIQGFQKNTEIKIFGYDILEQNKEWLEKNNHNSCSLEECIEKSDIIFLCVKPQDLKTLCDEIIEFNISSKTFVSVAAGVKISELENLLPSSKIFRAMPNVGAKDNLGVTAIYSNHDSKEMVKKFKFIGESYEVENEDQIDLHTVLIGSGPAFFYDLMQEFEKRLDELLTDKESKRLVSIVFLSSIINAIKNGENLEQLVESVASKGGTTEAALQKLDEKGFKKIFSEAVDAGIKRAKELSMN